MNLKLSMLGLILLLNMGQAFSLTNSKSNIRNLIDSNDIDFIVLKDGSLLYMDELEEEEGLFDSDFTGNNPFNPTPAVSESHTSGGG